MNVTDIYRRTQPTAGEWTIIDRESDDIVGCVRQKTSIYTGLQRGAIYTHWTAQIDGGLSKGQYLKGEGTWHERTWVITERRDEAYLFDTLKEGVQALYEYHTQEAK